ncbi:serine/threonine-protein phosphatase, partial [Micromonospora chalcea]
MTAADVRGADPGDGRISTPSAARVPAWSAAAAATPALPPLAADRGPAVPDWSEVVEHFREGLV